MALSSSTGSLHTIGRDPAGRINVVLGEHHGSMRQALRQVIDRQPDMRVVDEATDRAAVISAVCRHRPDVVLLDLSLCPGSGQTEVAALAAAELAELAETAIIVVSMDAYAPIGQLLAAGAAGFVLKDRADHELPAAIRSAAIALRARRAAARG